MVKKAVTVFLVLLLVASLIPAVQAQTGTEEKIILHQGQSYEETKNGLLVKWTLVYEGVTKLIYDIEIQNLDSTKSRLINLSSVFDNTSFDISQLKNVEFYEWKAVLSERTFYYDNENAPIYQRIYDNVVRIENGLVMVENYENVDNAPWKYVYENTLSIVGYQKYSKIENVPINQWKPCKSQYFQRMAKKYKEKMESITLPKFGSKPTYDNYGNLETENGTKRFRLEFEVPVQQTANGWGSEGRVAVEIDGIEYHPWFSTSWSYRRQITIDESKVDANLDNFPATVFLSASNFNFSKVSFENGQDIRFTDSSGTELAYEIENFSKTGQVGIIHIKIPSVSGTENTIFWIYYGNPTAGNGQNPTAVWDSNYKMIQHMKDATTSTTLDSTANANNGTKYEANGPAQTVNGKINGAQDFDGTNDYISVPDATSLNFGTGDFTIELWFNADAVSGNRQLLTKFLDSSSVERPGWRCEIGRVSAGKLDFVVYDGSGAGGSYSPAGATTLVAGTWYHAVFVRSNSGSQMSIYLNGTLDAGPASVTVRNVNNTEPLRIGTDHFDASPYYIGFFDGVIDEVRISSGARSAAWIKATYHSLNNTLLVVGAEQGPPNPPSSLQTENLVNPVRLTTFTPRFNFVYTDNYSPASKGDKVWIQVGTSAGDNSLWDSGWIDISPNTDNNTRCVDITYAGSALSRGVTYYWRARWQNEWGAISDWSTETATFRLNQLPTAPASLILNIPKVNENITAAASGSTDVDGDTITYYYEFYNVTDAAERKAYSTDNFYTVAVSDAHDNIAVRVLAFDGYENSSVFENSIVVANTPPTVTITQPTFFSFNTLQNITFQASGSDVDNDNLTFSWNFGDGTPAETGVTVIHCYLIGGAYITTVTASDGTDAAQTSVTLYIGGGGGGGYVAPENLENIPGISPNAPPVQNLLMWPLFSAFGIVFSLWMLLAAIAIVAYLTDQKGIVIATVLMFAFLLVFGTKLVQFIMP